MEKDENNVPHVDIACGVHALTKVAFYEDFIENVEYANAPILKPNSKAVIVFDNPKKKQIHACIFSTGEAEKFCATAMHISGLVSSCIAGVAVSLCKE
jgi:hypothetical protein